MSDLEIRYRIYRFFADECRAPSATEIASLLGCSVDEVRLAFRRLHDRHMIFADAATGEIRMEAEFAGRTIAEAHNISDAPGLNTPFWRFE